MDQLEELREYCMALRRDNQIRGKHQVLDLIWEKIDRLSGKAPKKKGTSKLGTSKPMPQDHEKPFERNYREHYWGKVWADELNLPH